MATILRLAGAALLLISLGLPMGSCSYFHDSSGLSSPAGESVAKTDDAQRVTQWSYVLDDFPREPEAWLTLAIFVFPIVAGVALARRPRGWTALLLRVIEIPVVLTLISIVDIVSTLFMSSREAGAYVAFAGAGFYLVGAVVSDIGAARNWRRERRARRGAPADARSGSGWLPGR